MSSSAPEPDPRASRVFSYGDLSSPLSPRDDEEVVNEAPDAYFDDDLHINFEEDAPAAPANGVHFGMLSVMQPEGFREDEAEQRAAIERAMRLQRTAEAFGEFNIGGDGDDEDLDEEDEVLMNFDDDDSPMPPRRAHNLAGTMKFGNPLFDLAAAGASVEEGEDGNEFADNAIGDQGIFSLATPSNAARHSEEDQEGGQGFQMVISRPSESPVYSYGGVAVSSSSPSQPHHMPAASRVFSYEDGQAEADDVSPSSTIHMNSLHLNMKLIRSANQPPQQPASAISSSPLEYNDFSPSPREPQYRPHGGSDANSPPSQPSGGGRGHHRPQSLQVPGRGSPDASPVTPGGGRGMRPSITSLSPTTIHNRSVSQDKREREKRPSMMLAADVGLVSVEHRSAIEDLLSVPVVKHLVTFPYSMETKVGVAAYDLAASFPAVMPAPIVSDFKEPALGVVTAIKGEEVRSILLSDGVYDMAEAPTRFTRPLRRREFHPQSQVKGLSALLAEAQRPGRHENIQCLILFNEKSVSLKQEVADLIQTLGFLETIQLQEVKLKQWKQPLVLPRLLNLDARNCKIKDIEIVKNLCLNSPHLYSLTISDNPICEKFFDPQTKKPCLPPFDNSIWKQLILRLPSLEYFNLLPIDNATRQKAYMYTKSKKLYPIVASTLWNMAFNASPAVVAMQASGWNNTTIVELSITGQSLMAFSLYPLRHSLERLTLSHNQITSLIGSGLHLCKKLTLLNLTHNKLHNLDELYLLGHLPLLRSLSLAGNAFSGSDYQGLAIYATRHVRGSNRAPGLFELDGLEILQEMRVQAYEKHALNGKVQAPKERWRLILAQQFGHQQLAELSQYFSKLVLTQRVDVNYVDLSALTGLISLDLSGNRLRTLPGLEKLTKLRFFDVRFNPELQVKLVIAQLQQIGESLEWISLSHNEEEMLDFTGLRFKVLCALLASCPRLGILDHRLITSAEFVRVFTKAGGFEKHHPVRNEYVLNLSLVMHNTPFAGRLHDAPRCLPNIQYKLEEIAILDISGLRLDDAFAMPALPNLTLLNVSNNKFSLLTTFGLARFPKLVWLDLRQNKLKFTPMEVAAALSVCPLLFGLALQGNPNYTPKYRQKLIACIPELASLDSVLRLIDDPVTVDERVSAWGATSQMLFGNEEGKGEHQRKKSYVHQLPVPDPANKRLYQLTLKVNADNLHIHALAKETIRLEEEEMLEALTPKPGQTTSAGPTSMLVAMRQSTARVGATMRSREQIKVEREQLEKGIFKFHLCLQQVCPPGVESHQVTTLGLGNFGMTWVDFRPFTSLTKLLISRNNLTSLAYAGIETLTGLTVLDAHHNKLTDLADVINLCNLLPNLEFISFMKNPFVVLNSGAPSTIGADGPDGDKVASPSALVSPSSAALLNSGAPLYSHEKYHLTFIGHLQQLQSPARRLKFLDFQPIGEDDVIRGLKELGHSAIDREMFRFNSLTFGKDGADPSFKSLDLSGKKLQRGDFTRFPHLTQLSLKKNLFSDETLLAAHMPQLKELKELDISDNQLKSMKVVAALVNSMPKLRLLKVTRNPGYTRSASDRSRRHFLACFENIHMTNFHLDFLNQQKITIDERIEAMWYARHHWEALHGSGSQLNVDLYSPRSIASPEEEEKKEPQHAATPPPNVGNGPNPSPSSPPASPSAVSPSGPPALTAAQLIAQGGLPISLETDIVMQMENARFILTMHSRGLLPTAKELDGRKANLRLLGGLTLGIASFENLAVVDLRENAISDLKDSGIDMLRHMHTLDIRANEFLSIESLIVPLRTCNALKWLHIQCATKDNNETGTPANYVARVFADLRGLKRCDDLENMQCLEDDELAVSAQQLLWKIAKIGPNNLTRVDLTSRRLPATLFYQVLSALLYLGIQELMAGGNNEWCLHPQYSDVIILLLGPKFCWLDGVEINDARRMLAFRADKVGKQTGKITGNAVLWEDSHAEIHVDVDEWLESERLRTGEEQELANKRQAGDLDWRLDLPNMQSVSVASSSSNSTMLANVITKLDIVIHYLQVYGMVLVMDINIPYPQVFKDWSTWIRLSTLDLSDIFNLDDDYKQQVLFAMVMAVPAIFLALYFYFDRLRGAQDEWADSYVTRWNTVKWRTFGLYIFLILFATMCAFVFIDNFATIDAFKKGAQPTAASLTWALIFFATLTIFYWAWFKIVRLFQKHWTADETEHKQEFKQKWLNLIHWAQIVFLFAITCMYLPVSRVILMQFACDTTTSVGTVYASLVYPSQECFPHQVNPEHYVAFVFAVLYIVGLPVFLIQLIKQGINIVMELNTIHENLGKEVVVLNKEIGEFKRIRSALTQNDGETQVDFQARQAIFTNNITEHKAQIVKKQKAQDKEYFNRINDPVRQLASTSLYAAYEYKWRYWKIIQIVQNLLLVCISLFVPQDLGSVSEGRVLLGALAIAACFIFVSYVRPYYDHWEDGMEIFAGFANTVTVFVALAIMYDVTWFTDDSHSTPILMAANVAAVLAFVVALIVVPCRILSRQRAVKKATKAQEKAMAELSAHNSTKHRNNKRQSQINNAAPDKRPSPIKSAATPAKGVAAPAKRQSQIKIATPAKSAKPSGVEMV